MKQKSRAWNLMLLLAATAVALMACEVVLRLIGFEYTLYPTRVQFGSPDPVMMEERYAADRDLLWVQKDYGDKVARWQESHPSVAFMGCSCTEFADYDRHLHQLTANELPGGRLHFVNLGVVGWSSYNGLRQLERDVLPMKPTVVTIMFGWNDHWVSFGIEDKAIGELNLKHSLMAVTLSRSRLVQLFNKFYVQVVIFKEDERRPERVSLPDFKANLEGMVRLAREGGAVPVLITAPSGHTAGQEPEYLEERWLNELSELVPLHRRYAEAVREVAREQGAVLVDLAAEFDKLPQTMVKQQYFVKDGIHLNTFGNLAAAKIILGVFREHGLMKLIAENERERFAE
jgi:lysophospholipase L1-like esterase